MCGGKEGVDMSHPLYILLAKSFPPDQGVGGDRRTPSPAAAWQEHRQVFRAGPWGQESCLWAPPPAGITKWD